MSFKELCSDAVFGCFRCGDSSRSVSPPQKPGPKKPKWPPQPTHKFELILLGTEGSGKSTFIKQMQIIHGTGFNDQERADYVPIIKSNIFDTMEILATQAQRLGIELEDPARQDDIATFRDVNESSERRLQAVRLLWNDQGIQQCFDRQPEYEVVVRINTSARYFLDKISDICDPHYLPTQDDIIRARRQTAGAKEYEFRVNNIEFRITDVGGDVQERRYWIDFLQDKVTCVIFLVALDEYDSYFYAEDEEGRQIRKNRLQESINVFRDIQQNRWMPHTTYILFLNKTDIFNEKIMTSNIVDHFPNFLDFPRNAGDGKRFINRMFNEQRADNNRYIYAHYTQATDEENIRVVFDGVREAVLQMNLRYFNLM